MAMQRDHVIETLADLAAPLGPLTSHDERLAQQEQWADTGGPELFEALVDLIAAPPHATPARAAPDDWTTVLVEVAGAIGRRHPELALQRLVPLLDRAGSRATALDVLGSVGDPRAVPALAALAGGALPADDVIHLAGALGEIGGDDACRALRSLRDATPPAAHELHDELAIALEMAGC